MNEKIGVIAILFTLLSVSSSQYPLILILCYAIHEGGHLFFAKACGVKMRKFQMKLFRLRLSYDFEGVSYKKELVVSLGGIVFNLVFLALPLIFRLKMAEITVFYILCNASLALMNIYPVSSLDGGRVLRCLLLLIFQEERAIKIYNFISAFAVGVLWIFAVYLQLVFNSNVSLFFISVFLLVQICFSSEKLYKK
ncbi:MAG: site-2 protease family protein [Clostridia bacterium]|nr:site-2 protease family protein [Clostridia bacterium]